MANIISNSPNIASLDTKVVVNLNLGTINIEVSPSVFITSGANNVKGAKVKVVTPNNDSIIKDYGTGYDIAPPMTGDVSVNIPKSASSYIYGNYKVYVQITDADDETYEDVTSFDLCAVSGAGKIPMLQASIVADCKAGKLYVSASQPPVYNQKVAEDIDNALHLRYPSGVLPELDFSVQNVGVKLFEGEYYFYGYSDVTYNMGGEVYFVIRYKYDCHKPVKCSFDESCISEGLTSLVRSLKSCSDKYYQETSEKVVEALLLIQTVYSVQVKGGDVSELLINLEEVLGCSCSCSKDGFTPIEGSISADKISITGCGVTSQVVGDTTVYNFGGDDFSVNFQDNGGIFTESAVAEDGCKKRQLLMFNPDKLYAKIKTYVSNTTEYNFWGDISKKALNGIDPECFNLTQAQFDNMSWKDFIKRLMQLACSGGNCNAVVSNPLTSITGSLITLSWTTTNSIETEVFVDGVQATTVLGNVHSIILDGYADGVEHDFVIIPKCSNGMSGTQVEGDFNYTGCPTIAPAILVSGDTFINVTCPFDLNGAVVSAPVGISYEWYSENNINPSKKITDIANAGTGVYFVFAKNAEDCYSHSMKISVSCATTLNCSAPQNPIAENVSGGVRVRFQSSAYPPPSNSYSVRRRKISDADVSGSYITLGAPSWNASVNRWETFDNGAVLNTVYVYRVISNCTSSSPSVDYTFAYFDCPSLALTPGTDFVDYQMTGSASVDKYEVSIFDAAGITLIAKDDYTPAYPTPITGSFGSLSPDTNYNVQATVTIGAYSNKCPMKKVKTADVLQAINIYGTVDANGSDIDITLQDTVPCNITATVTIKYVISGNPSVYTEDVSVVIASGQSSITKAVTGLPSGSTIAGVIESEPGKLTFSGNCGAQEYDFILSTNNDFEIKYGYTELNTTSGTPTLQDYIDSLASASDNDATFHHGDPVAVGFTQNVGDKVRYVAVPVTELVSQPFTQWSEVGNPLQQNLGIDPSFSTGNGNVWFNGGVEGAYMYYFTRSQTTFGGTINFAR